MNKTSITLLSLFLASQSVICDGGTKASAAEADKKPGTVKASAASADSDLTAELEKRDADWSRAEKLLPLAIAEVKQKHTSPKLLFRNMEDFCVHYEAQHDAVKTLASYKQMLQLDKELKGLNAEARAQKLADIGRILMWQGKYAESITYFKDAIKLQETMFRSVNYVESMVEYLSWLSNSYARTKKPADAIAAANKAVTVAEANKSKEKIRFVSEAQRNLGDVYLTTGDLAKAKATYSKVLIMDKANRPAVSIKNESLDLLGLARIFLAKKEMSKAEDFLKEAEAAAKRNGDQATFMLQPVLDWANLYECKNQPAEAEKQYKRALEYADKADNTLETTFVLNGALKSYEQMLRKQNRSADADAISSRSKRFQTLCGC